MSIIIDKNILLRYNYRRYGGAISQGKMKDPLAGLMMEYVRQTLIAAEQMKKNGDCIAGHELGDAVAVSVSEEQNGQDT